MHVPVHPNPQDLNIILVISNPREYSTRYNLAKEHIKRMQNTGAKVWIVESQFGPYRPFHITQANNPFHIQVRNHTELWVKESMINLAVNHISEKYPDWKYACAVDADIAFSDENWVTNTIEALQRYDFIQPWSRAVDLCPEFEILEDGQGKEKVYKSFMSQYVNGGQMKEGYEGWHPGYAHAFTRKFYETVGGMPDFCILGSGDRSMCTGLIGRIEVSRDGRCTDGYKHALEVWQGKALELKLNVGYIPGTIMHYWHGKKVNRKYGERWQILVDNKYNPYTDIKRNAWGLVELITISPRQIQLRDQARHYFVARNEDGTDK